MLDTETPGSLDPDIAALTLDELAEPAGDIEDGDLEDLESSVQAGTPSPTAAPTSAKPLPAPVSAVPTPVADPASPGNASTAPAGPAPNEPFAIKVDGTALPIEGVTQSADGSVTFKPDAWKHVRDNYIANRSRWVEKEKGFREQIRQAQQVAVQVGQRQSAQDAQADALTQALTGMMGLEDEQAVTEFLRLRAAFPQFQAKAERDHWKRIAEERDGRLAPIDAAAQWRAAEPELKESVQATVDEYLSRPDFAVLKPQRDALFAELWRMGMEEGAIGATPDGYRYDQRTFERHLKAEAGFAKRLEDERQKLEIGRRNAAVLTPGKQAPPTVPVNGAVAAPTGVGTPFVRTGDVKKDKEAHRARLRALMEEPT